MKYEFPPDVKQLVRERMASGQYASEDDVLREALQALAEEEADVIAIRQAVAEMDMGDEGIPLDEAFETIRRKHGLADST
jgi:putative addiction module CopG family antidote